MNHILKLGIFVVKAVRDPTCSSMYVSSMTLKHSKSPEDMEKPLSQSNKRCLNIFIQSFRESERNKIHARFTKKNVKAMRMNFGIYSQGFFNNLFKTLATPCNKPHKIKVQLAPCQIPLTRKTIKILSMVREEPFLLPPSGK